MYNAKVGSDDVVSSSVFNFGLNQGVTVTKLEYKQFANGECMNIEFTKEEKVVYGSIWKEKEPGEEVTLQDGTKIGKKTLGTINTFKHFMKAFITEDEANTVSGTDFKSFIENIIKVLTPHLSKPVDVFLEYGQLQTGKTSAYLQMPTVVFVGKFICPATTENFTEERTWQVEGKTKNGLRYVAGEKVHDFIRDTEYMKSEATDRKDGKTNQNNPLSTAAVKQADASEW